MGKFGWSLPPGCSMLPGEEEAYCDVCGEPVDDCICPTCPKCGAVGSWLCYAEHGMVLSQEQIARKKENEATWQALNDIEFDGGRLE